MCNPIVDLDSYFFSPSPPPSPKPVRTLTAEQRKVVNGIRHVLYRQPWVFNASPMGTGKTFMSLCSALELVGGKVVAIAPPVVGRGWCAQAAMDEFAVFGGSAGANNAEEADRFLKHPGPAVFVTTYGMLKMWFEMPEGGEGRGESPVTGGSEKKTKKAPKRTRKSVTAPSVLVRAPMVVGGPAGPPTFPGPVPLGGAGAGMGVFGPLAAKPTKSKPAPKPSERPVPTAQLVALIDAGVLFVFDECQAVKNTSVQAHYAGAIMNQVILARERCRSLRSSVIFASATPFDKPEQVLNFVTFVLTPTAYQPVLNKRTPFSGADERVLGPGGIRFLEMCGDMCYKLGLDKDSIVRKPHTFRKREEVMEHMWDLWRTVVCLWCVFAAAASPVTASAAAMSTEPEASCATASSSVSRSVTRPAPDAASTTMRTTGCPLPITAVTIAYRADPTVAQKITAAYEDVILAYAKAEQKNQSIVIGLATLMCAIEFAKVPVFLAAANAALAENPGVRVILAVNYLATLHTLTADLDVFGVVNLYGDMNLQKRGEALRRFQELDGPRVMVMTIGTGSTGIDLDDQHGTNPRVMIISPNYCAMGVTQACGRVARHLTKSSPTLVVACTDGLAISHLRVNQRLAEETRMPPTTAQRKRNKKKGAERDAAGWLGHRARERTSRDDEAKDDEPEERAYNMGPGSETAVLASLMKKAAVMAQAVSASADASEHPGMFPIFRQCEDGAATRIAGVDLVPARGR